MAGLVSRLRRQSLRMGRDSIAVLIIYTGGIMDIATIAGWRAMTGR